MGCSCGRQRKRDIRPVNRRLRCRLAGKIVRMCSCLRSRAEHDIFTSVDLVYRGHSFKTSFKLRFPQHLARGRV